MDASRILDWAHGSMTVLARGAMLGPVTFRLPDGRQARPLWAAPWGPEETPDTLLQTIRGEWPCVPFGYSSPAGPETPPDWAAVLAPGEAGEWAHGYGSHHDWVWEDAGPGTVAMHIDYPAGDPIRRLTRTLTPDPAAAAIDLTLTIEARDACSLPLGLHFTFAMSDTPRALTLDPGPFAEGRTFPGRVEAGRSLVASDQGFVSLAQVPAAFGGPLDLTGLPLDAGTEELLMLNGARGEVRLRHDAEGWQAVATWDVAVFPSLLIWLSNKGRQYPPWNARNLALGLEPVISPFGFGVATAAGPNPLAAKGTPTARSFRAGEVLTTRYRLAVEPI